jgi:hypothetical protein
MGDDSEVTDTAEDIRDRATGRQDGSDGDADDSAEPDPGGQGDGFSGPGDASPDPNTFRSPEQQQQAERFAKRLREETGRDDIQADDITVVEEDGQPVRVETNFDFQRELVAERLTERTGVDVDEGDIRFDSTDPDQPLTLDAETRQELREAMSPRQEATEDAGSAETGSVSEADVRRLAAAAEGGVTAGARAVNAFLDGEADTGRSDRPTATLLAGGITPGATGAGQRADELLGPVDDTVDEIAGDVAGATIGNTLASYRALFAESGSDVVSERVASESRAAGEAVQRNVVAPFAGATGELVDVGATGLTAADAIVSADRDGGDVGGTGVDAERVGETTAAERDGIEASVEDFEAAREDVQATEDTFSTPAGTVAEKATAGVGSNLALLASGPARIQSVGETTAESAEFTAEALQDEGLTEGTAEATAAAGSAAATRLEQTVNQAVQNPIRTAGQLVGSALIMGGAARLSSSTGLTTRAAIQPGEELIGYAGNRALPGRVGSTLFPDNEPLLLSEEAGIRGTRRVASAVQTSVERAGAAAGRQSRSIRRLLASERAQGDFGRLVTGSESESTEITAEDIADPQAEPEQSFADPSEALPDRVDDPRAFERRRRSRREEIGAEDVYGYDEAFRRTLSRNRDRDLVEEAQTPSVEQETTDPLGVEEALGTPFRSMRTVEATDIVQRQEQSQEGDLPVEPGSMVDQDQEPDVAADTEVGIDDLLETEQETGAELVEELETEQESELEQELEQELETEQETESELRQALELETEQETEQETETELFEVESRRETERDDGDEPTATDRDLARLIESSGDVGDDQLDPGWFDQFVVAFATGGGGDRGAPDQGTLEDRPLAEQLTGSLPTEAQVSGSEETQEQIEATFDLFGGEGVGVDITDDDGGGLL